MSGQDGSVLKMDSQNLSSTISSMQMLTGDGILGGSQGLSHLNEKYFKDISENPSLENILKTVGKFTSEDLDDPELKEI